MKTLLSPWMQRIALVSHLALMLAIAMVSTHAAALVLIVPLLLPLPGLVRGRDFTHAWATMLIAFYVGGWLAAGYAYPAQKWLNFVIAGIAALEFVALNLFVRFRAKERTARTAASSDAAH